MYKVPTTTYWGVMPHAVSVYPHATAVRKKKSEPQSVACDIRGGMFLGAQRVNERTPSNGGHLITQSVYISIMGGRGTCH